MNRIYTLLLAFALWAPLGAMDLQKSTAVSSLLAHNRRDAIIDQINAAQEFVGVATPFFSDRRVQDALIAAKSRGVDVCVKVAARAKVAALEQAGIPVEYVKNLHAKMVTTDKDAVLGSDNLSATSAERENELFVRGDSQQVQKSFNQISHEPYQRHATPKKATPKKPVLHRGHNGYKANRLKRFVTEPSSHNTLDVASMTFDSDRFVRQVEKTYAKCPSGKAPRLRFFLDRSALKHTDLLDRMQRAGADKVSIYIYNTDGSAKIWDRFPDIAHQKYMARTVVSPGGTQKKHVTISTGNLADMSDRQINYDAHYPADAAMHDELVSRGNDYASHANWTRYSSDNVASSVQNKENDVQ